MIIREDTIRTVDLEDMERQAIEMVDQELVNINRQVLNINCLAVQ